jgi:hypothetical protein
MTFSLIILTLGALFTLAGLVLTSVVIKPDPLAVVDRSTYRRRLAMSRWLLALGLIQVPAAAFWLRMCYQLLQ